MNIKPEITLTFDIGLEVRHLEVVIDPVHDKVWEPWVFPSSLEQFIEKLEAFLAKIISENFEAHKGLILRECLGK